jgi:uridine monophosphate synthetase
MNFIQFLEARVNEVDSLLCVGLDPRGENADALRAECLRLIDATVDVAAAYKPNSAFFEAQGVAGLQALQAVIHHIPPDIPVILDAKRGDIADTAVAYAQAAFDVYGAHALTVSPYLGGDTVQPFVARPERGAFVLCKTSNAGADELQALPIDAADDLLCLYEVIARHALSWSSYNNLGLVVGATDPTALTRVRAIAPQLWFLVPGIGAQGGDLTATLVAGLRADGRGLLINVSRQLARAADPRQEALKLRAAINAVRAAGHRSQAPAAAFSQLAADLVASGCVRFGEFTLKSGLLSPIYMDLRRLVTHPTILRRVAQAYAATLRPLTFDRLAGIPYAALPIATAIALEMNRPLIYPRKEAKEYGTRALIEGDFTAGETALVIDDVATTGGSKLEAIEKLTAAGLIVRDIVVLIDRGQGAAELLAQAGYQLHTVLTLPALLDEWLRSGAIDNEQYERVRALSKQ